MDIGTSDAIKYKITDLGLSRKLAIGQMATTKLGTAGYFPTQIIYDEKYSHKTDVWGLGCVFFQLLTGFTPFVGSANNKD